MGFEFCVYDIPETFEAWKEGRIECTMMHSASFDEPLALGSSSLSMDLWDQQWRSVSAKGAPVPFQNTKATKIVLMLIALIKRIIEEVCEHLFTVKNRSKTLEGFCLHTHSVRHCWPLGRYISITLLPVMSSTNTTPKE